MHAIFHHVSFGYDDAVDVLSDLSAHFSPGWTGIVGANGTGKSTLLKLASGLLRPLAGSVETTGRALYCAQRTDAAPEDLRAFLTDQRAEGHRLRRALAVAPEWPDRWDSLSHGERRRAQIGVALWLAPDVLAIDEPTGHLDEEAQRMLHQALGSFTGVGILVSHDRDLLDGLCSRCLFLEPGAATMRAGTYTQANRERLREQVAARREHETAAAEVRRLRQRQTERRRRADQADARRSARGLARRDSDGRARRRLAVVSGKDGQAGRLLSQLDARLCRAEQRLAAGPHGHEQQQGIWLPGARSPRRTVLSLEAGELPLGTDRRLAHPPLAVERQDRVAITGPNGSGKTTLLRQLIETTETPEDRIVYLSQEISATESARLLDQARASDDDTLGRLFSVVSRLGSAPEPLLTSRLPSPGETRKLLLALGILREPHVVVMDEPTNHLDLPAIERLEEALAEAPCALLLVSHERRFLSRLCGIEWRLETDEEGTRLCILPMGPDREKTV